MAFSRVSVHFGRGLSETGRMLDKVGCRLKGVLPFEVELNRQQTLQKFGEIYPTVGRGSFIAPNSKVIGEVHIGSGSSVGFGSTVRGDVNYIRLGDNVHIGDLVTVHCTREGLKQTGYETNIGHGVVVGPGSHVHGCTLEDDAFIHEGVTILDGAVVGTQAVVGAGSLVLTGTRIPAKQYWAGTPAKYVRDLSEEDLAKYKAKATAVSQIAQKHLKWDSLSEEAKQKADPKDLFARE